MLIYLGSPGAGKTYFCSAITEWSFLRFHTRRYHKESDLCKRLRNAISEGVGDYLIHLRYFIDDELVILDDIGSSINPHKHSTRDLEFRREILLEFLDYRYNTRRPTIVISNFNKDEILDVYAKRIHSRMFAKENTVISRFGDDVDKRQIGM